MKKITAKHITENLESMAHGEHINYRGGEYWMACNMDNCGIMDTKNGTIYFISRDRKLSGSINGVEFAQVVDGIACKIG